jgi:peptidoglycan/xylan/chitin deacetylase (PgdA/CDA1 family)
MKIFALFVFFAVACLAVDAQPRSNWNGFKSAVVLTYDDALNVHLDNVIPALDSAGFKGTFYLTASSDAFTKRMDEWKLAAAKGHELGNHTMFHPCRGDMPGREWVRAEYDLSSYTLKRVRDEIKMTNVMLQSLDGKTERTFAYPCGDVTAGGLLYIEAITPDFVAARGVEPVILQQDSIDLFTVGCFSIAGQSSEYMIDIVKKGMKENGLVVFLFHGVGGEHGLNVDLKEHQELIAFLKQNQNEIWITTFVDVMKYVKSRAH